MAAHYRMRAKPSILRRNNDPLGSGSGQVVIYDEMVEGVVTRGHKAHLDDWMKWMQQADFVREEEWNASLMLFNRAGKYTSHYRSRRIAGSELRKCTNDGGGIVTYDEIKNGIIRRGLQTPLADWLNWLENASPISEEQWKEEYDHWNRASNDANSQTVTAANPKDIVRKATGPLPDGYWRQNHPQNHRCYYSEVDNEYRGVLSELTSTIHYAYIDGKAAGMKSCTFEEWSKWAKDAERISYALWITASNAWAAGDLSVKETAQRKKDINLLWNSVKAIDERLKKIEGYVLPNAVYYTPDGDGLKPDARNVELAEQIAAIQDDKEWLALGNESRYGPGQVRPWPKPEPKELPRYLDKGDTLPRFDTLLKCRIVEVNGDYAEISAYGEAEGYKGVYRVPYSSLTRNDCSEVASLLRMIKSRIKNLNTSYANGYSDEAIGRDVVSLIDAVGHIDKVLGNE